MICCLFLHNNGKILCLSTHWCCIKETLSFSIFLSLSLSCPLLTVAEVPTSPHRRPVSPIVVQNSELMYTESWHIHTACVHLSFTKTDRHEVRLSLILSSLSSLSLLSLFSLFLSLLSLLSLPLSSLSSSLFSLFLSLPLSLPLSAGSLFLLPSSFSALGHYETENQTKMFTLLLAAWWGIWHAINKFSNTLTF